ncbi:hypothetical protein OSTOST_06112 [Ostertagia ostertagi]
MQPPLLISVWLIQGVLGIVELFTTPELRYTFGVDKHSDVPPHLEIDPKLSYNEDGSLSAIEFQANDKTYQFELQPTLGRLLGEQFTVIHRNYKRGENGVHVVFKREIASKGADFCGLDNIVTEDQLVEYDSAIFEDVFVTGQRLQQMSDLVVELAVFVDETLWRHFSSKVRLLEVLTTMAMHRMYLDRFCRFQRNLGIRDWDHAIMLTGYGLLVFVATDLPKI